MPVVTVVPKRLPQLFQGCGTVVTTVLEQSCQQRWNSRLIAVLCWHACSYRYIYTLLSRLEIIVVKKARI